VNPSALRAFRRARDSMPQVRDFPAEPDRSPPHVDASERRLRTLAHRIRRARLAPVAVLWLESIRPLAFLGGQLMISLAPLLSAWLPDERLEETARLLEDRTNLDRLLAYLEQPDVLDAESRS
jgi:hypothetical protein